MADYEDILPEEGVEVSEEETKGGELRKYGDDDAFLEAILPSKSVYADSTVLQTMRFNAGQSGGFYKLGGSGEGDALTEVKVILLGRKNMRVYMPPMEGVQTGPVKPICKSSSGEVSDYGAYLGTACANCEFSKWGANKEAPKCRDEIALLLWLVDLNLPAVVCFKGKGRTATNQFLSRLSRFTASIDLPSGKTTYMSAAKIPYLFPIILSSSKTASGNFTIHVPEFKVLQDEAFSAQELLELGSYERSLTQTFEEYGIMRDRTEEEISEVLDVDDNGQGGDSPETEPVSEMGVNTEPESEVLVPQEAAGQQPSKAAPAAQAKPKAEPKPKVEAPAEEPKARRGRPRKTNW